MFSIAAINDTDTRGQWEPLAPTKEAQEFHLTQKYHEGLLKLQSKDYQKACELLEAVLQDPLVSGARVDDGHSSDGHLLQLRFLALKNLATVFLEQGSGHFKNALNCYLQAVEIDDKDSVVWNQLGTLSCSMGLLSTSRWAFEQGLLCSPNNWNCMEKLLEVLIAIGDEAACLTIADIILRHWPSHARAIHVKRTIEDGEPTPFAPRGIDKLEPNHSRLIFSNKRKATDEIDEGKPLKRANQSIEISLPAVTWDALTDEVLEILYLACGESHNPGFQFMENETGNMVKVNLNDVDGNKDTNISHDKFKIEKSEQIRWLVDFKVIVKLPSCAEPVKSSPGVPGAGKEIRIIDTGKLGSVEDDHHQERRSTRLERLRNRKPGKEEVDNSSSKDLARLVFQFLEPFVFCCKRDKDDILDDISQSPEIPLYLHAQEHADVLNFVSATSENHGAYHLGHQLLEEIAQKNITYKENIAKLLDLDKLTRGWPQDRSPFCSLFLAELYYDSGLVDANQSKRSEMFSEASYYLCKVIEWAALHSDSCPPYASFVGSETSNYSKEKLSILDGTDMTRDLKMTSFGMENDESLSQMSRDGTPLLENSLEFWIRFSWLSACLSVMSGNNSKAIESFSLCFSIFKRRSEANGVDCHILLPHCKLIRWLNQGRVEQQINLLKIQTLSKRATDLMVKEKFRECIDLVAPFLCFTDDSYTDIFSSAPVENRHSSDELLALDLLISACERIERLEIEVYLNSHSRKLQLLAATAGMNDLPDGYSLKRPLQKNVFSDSDELAQKQCKQNIAQEVKEMSRCASLIKKFNDQHGSACTLGSLTHIIGESQLTLLRVMYGFGRSILGQRLSISSNPTQTDQMETQCLVDAAIAFCKLQHLDPAVPVKTQVDLIVAIHELLAEFGLCCAGKDDEGKEGTFLKLAIKHLLALDVKLKSGSQFLSERPEPKQTDGRLSHVDQGITVTDQNKGFLSSDTSMDAKFESDSLPKLTHEDSEKSNKEKDIDTSKDGYDLMPYQEQTPNKDYSDRNSLLVDIEREKVELGIENALDQSFFCLYGLDLRSSQDSSCEDDLSIHRNTSRGDYQTKEQCADVFHYILPYAKVSSRAGMVKLRRVLRAIRKHFPRPVDDALESNFIDRFLDNPSFSEDQLFEIAGVEGNHDAIISFLYGNESSDIAKKLTVLASGPYSDVYSNLYYYIALAEEISATDKLPGFVLNKDGEEFVEQNANLLIYDLLYNPLRFESWQKLANIYDEEVDLLLNDGSKHITIGDWRKNSGLLGRVERGRRRSRRCLLMSLALARTPTERSQVHELLGLVYYDSLQNVVPFYDQRTVVPSKNDEWLSICRNSLKNFEKAFALKRDWIHAFYLGKLCEKMSYPPSKAFSYYNDAISLNPTAVDPFYRMHASRLKLLSNCGSQDVDALQTISSYSFNEATKKAVFDILTLARENPLGQPPNVENVSSNDSVRNEMFSEHQIDKAWHLLFDDCLLALGTCTEGELKHYHKARYTFAQGLCKRSEDGDLERAKDELSFCFKSSRSSFTINMWEIDSMAKKTKRKTPSHGGNKRTLEVNLPESSRKFITCIRKYILMYLELLENLKDLPMLERAYTYLRTDRRFMLCIGDIVPLALGRYIKVLTSSIFCAEASELPDAPTSLEHLLEKMFHVLMDHMNLWGEISVLPEIKCSEISEASFYGFIHQFIHSLECNVRLDALEGINEKIRKRFKNPKLASPDCAKVCRHASLAWCRSIVIKLASITPLGDSGATSHQPDGLENGLLLFVDLQPNELYGSLEYDLYTIELEKKWCNELSKIRNVRVKQVFGDNMEAAASLLKYAYSFYRDSSCGTFPSGINLYTMALSQPVHGEPWNSGKLGVDILDISIPRKLLLWSYTLVHGYYSNILAVVKYCEENTKLKMKRGVATVLSCSTAASAQTSLVKERNIPEERAGADDNLSTIPGTNPPLPNEPSMLGPEPHGF